MNKREIRHTLEQLDRLPLPDREAMLRFYQPQARPAGTAPRRPAHRRFAAVCAAAVLVIAGAAGIAVVAEAREYNTAVAFFEQNDLSSQGLTREELKRVYRDIKTGAFTYGKTADVLARSVSGYEIFQQEPTPQDLEEIWNYKNSGDLLAAQTTQSDMRWEYHYQMDSTLGFERLAYTTLTKWEGDTELWSAELRDFVISGTAAAGEYVVVFGESSSWSSEQRDFGRLALIDADGTVLWDISPDNGFHRETYSQALCDESGIVVFGRGDLEQLCFTRYDYSGNCLQFEKQQVGLYGIGAAVRLNDGYLVQLRSFSRDILMRLDADGSAVDSFTYTADDAQYVIRDMLPFGGKIYLSAYAVPKTGEDREGLNSLVEYIFEQRGGAIAPDELTPLLREHYTAVLLVCDSASGQPVEFYSVRGSVGAELTESDGGSMVWEVESIADVSFSPMTSSFTFGGTSRLFRYEFDRTGFLIHREKTGELRDFRR
ncbi:hypothetical protein [Feifania hominis]|uniref:Uncharacterized protein n=1 Tax=Feifania hominis TaxID=2763660 RepID=A0A926DC31_9FIRM|nr:hypothetical protein [Feifania hominis]MBC8535808.1 hypothetical protein [Feifania hominis]